MKCTIYTLIYKSTKFAEWIYESIHKNTPEIQDGSAKFKFIANDATNEVIDFLDKKGYEYEKFKTPFLTEQELRKAGFTDLFYIHSIYAAYNYAIKDCNTEIIAIVDSDTYPSYGWLTPLLDHAYKNYIVTPKSIEPPKPNGIFINKRTKEQIPVMDFGNTIATFQADKFEEWASKNIQEGYRPISGYKPLIAKSEILKKIPFPKGNLISSIYPGSKATRRHKGEAIECGDEAHIRELQEQGYKCISMQNSIVYHLDQGEKKEKE